MQVSSWKALMYRLSAQKCRARAWCRSSPATSWTWTSATFSTLATPWSFASFFFWQPIFSTYCPLYTSHVFPDLFFISDLCFLFLFFSIAKNSFDLASSFFRRNFHFWAFVKREYSSFLGRPERIKVWIFSSLISFLPSSCKNKKIPRTLTCRVY